MASLWYCAAGHGRRDIAAAVDAQLGMLAAYSCFDPFTNPAADALAERLADLSPVPNARVFMCDSGSEAVDTAMKLARLTQRLAGHPERTLIISRERGYHGTNLGGTTAQGIPPNREGWGPLVPDVVHVPGDDQEAITGLMATRGDEVAAILTEPVQGAGGVYPPPEGYLAELRRLCDRHGALLVFDEVITAFGRLGEWFAADHFDVLPDLTTFAKAVTSGYVPFGGVIVGPTVRAALESDPAFVLRHGYTYSGHSGACAAALANLDVLEREGLLAEAVRLGSRLETGLRALAADGLVAGVRGAVAVWALALHEGQDSPAIRDQLLERGVVTRAIPPDTITFCPPLVTTDEQIDRVVDAVAGVLGG